MRMILQAVLIVLLLVFTCHAKEGYELLLVQVTTRHGARSPLKPLPDEPKWTCAETSIGSYFVGGESQIDSTRFYRKHYLNGIEYLPGNCSLGQLTAAGAAMHVKVGQLWRKRYIEDSPFLRSELTPGEIYVRSSDLSRTEQSAEAQLNGMYPYSLGDRPRVVDMYTMDFDKDYIYENLKNCPLLAYMELALMTDPVYVNYLKKIEPVKEQIAALMGVEPLTLDWVTIFDCWEARMAQGLPMTKGMTKHMLATAIEWATFAVKHQYSNPKFTRLAIGKLVEEQFNNMLHKISRKNPYKFMVYSGHDSTVAPLLSALNISDFYMWPEFAAHITTELYQDKAGQYFVRFLYMDQEKVPEYCRDYEIFGLCPIDVVKQGLAKYFVSDYEKACSMMLESNSW